MILVFGKSGQVARALGLHSDTMLLGRQQCDLRYPDFAKQAIEKHNPVAVINAAAYTSVEQAENEEDIANQINGEAPGVMAETCKKLNIPLVHISTDYVFNGDGCEHRKTFDPTMPLNAYGRSKLNGELAIKAANCTHAILRTSWVFSEHGSNFVNSMLQLLENKDQINVVFDQVGGPTFATDLAAATLSIAQQLISRPEKSGTYHYSGAPDVSWFEFARTISEHLGRKGIIQPIATSEYQTRVTRPLNSRLDCGTTKSTFGIPRPNWKIGLKSVLETRRVKHNGA